MKNLLLNFGALLAVGALASCSGVPDDSIGKKEEHIETETPFDFLKKGIEPPKLADSHHGPVDDGVRTADNPELRKQLEKLEAVPAPKKSPAAPPPSVNRAPRFYDDLIQLNGDDRIKASIVFNSAPLLDVIPAFADALGFDFLADSDLKSVVTVNFNSHMTRRELYEAFDQMLQLAGAGVMRNPGSFTLRILPAAKIAQQPDLQVAPLGDGSGEVLYFVFRNVNVSDIQNQLKPFLGTNSAMIPLSRQNAILIGDNRTNIPKLRQLLELIDRDNKEKQPRAMIYCRNLKPSKMVTELATIMPILGFTVSASSTGNTVNANEIPGAIQLTGLDRLQVVVAGAANQEAIDEIRKWSHILDNSIGEDQEQVYIYKVSHSRADQLTQALSVVFNTQATSLTTTTNTSTGVTTTQTQQITTQTTAQPAANAANLAALSNSMTNTQSDRNSSVFESPVKVFADGIFNRLVIRTTPRTYAVVKALLDRIDVVPAQVLLQVTVMEVSLTDSTEFGLEMSYTNSNGNFGSLVQTNYSNLDSSKVSDTSKVANQGGVFEIFNPNDPNEKFGHIKALAGNKNIKVVSSPQILVTSNTQAEIQVGQSVPYIRQSLTDSSSSSGNVTKTYDYQDVGIILKIMPQITSTNLISLDLTQTISEADFTKNSETPIFDQRIVKTTMTIANGRTMVIGGLIKEKRSDNLSSLPFISEIPFLRRLVGSTDYSTNRIEMLVLITGYIINERSPLEDLIKRYNEAVEGLNQFEHRIERKQQETAKKAEERKKIKLQQSPEVRIDGGK